MKTGFGIRVIKIAVSFVMMSCYCMASGFDDFVNDGVSEIRRKKNEEYKELAKEKGKGIIHKAVELNLPCEDANILVSFWLQTNTNNLSVAMEFLEKYGEVPVLIEYNCFIKDKASLYDIKELEVLFQTKVVMDSIKQQRQYYEVGAAGINYGERYIPYLLKTFPNNLVIRRVFAEYCFAPYADNEYFDKHMRDIIASDVVTYEIYKDRKRGHRAKVSPVYRD